MHLFVGFDLNRKLLKLPIMPVAYWSGWNIMDECTLYSRGRILGRNWDKSLQSFPLLAIHRYKRIFLPPPPRKKWFETGL
jgi:hypothetical protein